VEEEGALKVRLELFDERRARLVHELVGRLLAGEMVRLSELRERVDHKWLYSRLVPCLEALGVARRVYERG